jgi:hypothetical protein
LLLHQLKYRRRTEKLSDQSWDAEKSRRPDYQKARAMMSCMPAKMSEHFATDVFFHEGIIRLFGMEK